MTSVPVARTHDFLATLGVDTHVPYTDGGYADVAKVAADLAYLGISQVRDGLTDGEAGSAPLSHFIELAQQGVQFTLVTVGSDTAGLDAQIALTERLVAAVPGSVVALEGANEINNWPVTFNGVGGLQGAINLQSALYSAVHGDPALTGVAVDYFTGYGSPSLGTGPDPSTTPGLADYDNQHPYPQNGSAPGVWVDPARAVGNETPGQFGPLVYTETGYSSNGGTAGAVNRAVQARYTLDLLFDDMADGISRTYLYELMDAYPTRSPQGNAGMGLFDTSGNPKPVATGIHNLTAILADPGTDAGTFTTGAFAPTITNLPANGRSLILQKSSGVYDIILWAEPQIWNSSTGKAIAAPRELVALDLGVTSGSVSVFDPLRGPTAFRTSTGVRRLQVALTDHPVVVEVTPRSPATAVTHTGPLQLEGAAAFQGSDAGLRSGDKTDLGSFGFGGGTPQASPDSLHTAALAGPGSHRADLLANAEGQGSVLLGGRG